MYVAELRDVFCEITHLSESELRAEQWGARLGLILNEIGYPLATLGKIGAGSRVTIREWVGKLRKRLETDVVERTLIANLKTALAERVFEIQMANAAGVTKSRATAATSGRLSAPSEVVRGDN